MCACRLKSQSDFTCRSQARIYLLAVSLDVVRPHPGLRLEEPPCAEVHPACNHLCTCGAGFHPSQPTRIGQLSPLPELSHFLPRTDQVLGATGQKYQTAKRTTSDFRIAAVESRGRRVPPPRCGTRLDETTRIEVNEIARLALILLGFQKTRIRSPGP